MRKVISLFALMILLLPLSGCFGGEEQRALDAALTIRGEYLALSGVSTQVRLQADYGQRVYDFALDVSIAADEIILTVTEPELVAGVTARTDGQRHFLEYEDLCIETGPLDADGLTPLSAVPSMLRAVREEYITECRFDGEGLLCIRCAGVDAPPGTGTEYVLWLHPDTHDLTRGEIFVDGILRVTCTFSPFTKE